MLKFVSSMEVGNSVICIIVFIFILVSSSSGGESPIESGKGGTDNMASLLIRWID
jgi:hypothetical protein